MDTKKLIHLLPFLLLLLLVLYTSYSIIFQNNFISIKHIIGLSLIIFNSTLYFYKFKFGVIVTGIIYILSMLNVIALFPTIIYKSYFLRIGDIKISTPFLEVRIIIFFVIYMILNYSFFIFKKSE